MLDANNLMELIKKAAMEAVEAGKPSDFCFGRVINTMPLKILVEQKMTLTKAQLILTRNATDYSTQITLNMDDETASGQVRAVQAVIHNGLKKDERVVLLKQKGGQKYLVLDRVVKI